MINTKEIKCRRELIEFMEEDESRWQKYVKERPQLNISKNAIKNSTNQTYTEWINLNKNKLVKQLSFATNFNRFFSKNLLLINKSPLVRHIAYINFDKNPLKFEEEKEKIVPYYIPVV